MNKLRRTPFSPIVLLLCFITIGAVGQSKSKTFNETFSVSKEAVLDVNTSHTDIEFETWSKDEIEIEATIEIEGATEEEAAQYFEGSGFEILGNSKKVTISTNGNNNSFRSHLLSDLQNFHIEIPEFPQVQAFDFDFEFEDLIEMPALPISPKTAFDHKAFKKDGEKYLKKWQKEFQDSFDEEHIEELERWSERMEERQEKMVKKRAEMIEKRSEMREKRDEKREERQEKMAEAREKRMELQLERRAKNDDDESRVIIINGDRISTKVNGGPSIFYSSSNGSNNNYKVKKTIKVKMPKGMKIKMDVRHGEVKLAENTKNLNAILSHASLWASTIDGDQTTISASYSPVSVQNWNYGQLNAKYSDNVALKEVLHLRLDATSSDVTIDNLVNTAFIQNAFGPLLIKSVDSSFSEIDIALQNAELSFKTPGVPFTIYVNGTSSDISMPENITLEQTKNHNTTIQKGYFKNKNADSAITINSKHSDVVFN